MSAAAPFVIGRPAPAAELSAEAARARAAALRAHADRLDGGSMLPAADVPEGAPFAQVPQALLHNLARLSPRVGADGYALVMEVLARSAAYRSDVALRDYAARERPPDNADWARWLGWTKQRFCNVRARLCDLNVLHADADGWLRLEGNCARWAVEAVAPGAHPSPQAVPLVARRRARARGSKLIQTLTSVKPSSRTLTSVAADTHECQLDAHPDTRECQPARCEPGRHAASAPAPIRENKSISLTTDVVRPTAELATVPLPAVVPSAPTPPAAPAAAVGGRWPQKREGEGSLAYCQRLLREHAPDVRTASTILAAFAQHECGAYPDAERLRVTLRTIGGGRLLANGPHVAELIHTAAGRKASGDLCDYLLGMAAREKRDRRRDARDLARSEGDRAAEAAPDAAARAWQAPGAGWADVAFDGE